METRPDTERGASYEPSVPAAAPEKASLVEDFIDIFYTPSTVFARRVNSGFWTHLIIVAVIAALFAFANRGVFSQIFDAEFSRAAARMTADPRITQDVIDQQRKFSTAAMGFFQYVGTPIMILMVALVGWGVARIMSIKLRYGQLAMIATLAFIPRLVWYLLITVQTLLMDTTTTTSMFGLSISPARFMDPDSPNRMLMGLASRLDVFVLWSTLLIAIGVAVMGKTSRAKGFVVAAIVWVLGGIPLLFQR
jgi:hypothetical protein